MFEQASQYPLASLSMRRDPATSHTDHAVRGSYGGGVWTHFVSG
jgi:hypothetical protein